MIRRSLQSWAGSTRPYVRDSGNLYHKSSMQYRHSKTMSASNEPKESTGVKQSREGNDVDVSKVKQFYEFAFVNLVVKSFLLSCCDQNIFCKFVLAYVRTRMSSFSVLVTYSDLSLYHSCVYVLLTNHW